MHRSAAALTATLLAALLAVTGCTSGGDSDRSAVAVDDGGGGGAAAERAPGAADGQPPAGGRTGAGSAASVQLTSKSLIRTAFLTVRTKNLSRAADRARTATEAAGGYVSDESTSREGDGSEHSRMTLRVPVEEADEYGTFLDGLAGLGRLVHRDVEVKDVTDQVIDVDSRVRSQRASVERVRALMADATKLTDVVSLEGELSRRQADLESLLARQESLGQRTELATVTLELLERHQRPEEDDETTIGSALTGGWDAFVTALRAVVIGIAAALPFLAVLALLAVAWRLLRRFLPQRRVTAPPSPFHTQPDPQGGTEA